MPQERVTAAVLLIGDELLSGRTQDQNIGYVAEYLTAVGIDLNPHSPDKAVIFATRAAIQI